MRKEFVAACVEVTITDVQQAIVDAGGSMSVDRLKKMPFENVLRLAYPNGIRFNPTIKQEDMIDARIEQIRERERVEAQAQDKSAGVTEELAPAPPKKKTTRKKAAAESNPLGEPHHEDGDEEPH